MRHVCAVLVVAAVLASGCQENRITEGAAPGVRVRSDLAPQARINMDTAVVIDPGLQNWQGREQEDRYARVAVERTGARRTGTGTLEVWAQLRNRTERPIAIEGRTQFFDSDLGPCEGPSAWKRVFLPPNSVDTYKTYSRKIQSPAHYYIEIREAR